MFDILSDVLDGELKTTLKLMFEEFCITVNYLTDAEKKEKSNISTNNRIKIQDEHFGMQHKIHLLLHLGSFHQCLQCPTQESSWSLLASVSWSQEHVTGSVPITVWNTSNST